MGMRLDAVMIYGVAWGVSDAPSQRYDDALVPEEVGEPVYGGRLVWGDHGYWCAEPEIHLAVCGVPRPEAQGRFALRAPMTDLEDTIRWDTWIIDYLTQLGVPPEKIPVPGWLGLACWG